MRKLSKINRPDGLELSPFFFLVMNKERIIHLVNESVGDIDKNTFRGSEYLSNFNGDGIATLASNATLQALSNPLKKHIWYIDMAMGARAVRIYEEMVYINVGLEGLLLNVGAIEHVFEGVPCITPGSVMSRRAEQLQQTEYYIQKAEVRRSLGVRFQVFVMLHGEECIYRNCKRMPADQSYLDARAQHRAPGEVTRWETEEVSRGRVIWHNELCFFGELMIWVRSPVERAC